MGRFSLVIGGSGSGKSDFALRKGEILGEKRVFLATARVSDPEMEARIKRHQSTRGSSWKTLEEPLNIRSRLSSLPADTDVVLIDCVTVFLSNLIIEKKYGDSELLGETDHLVSVIHESPFPVIVVTNEVGLGLVPADPLGRRFRDLAGIVNQRLAQEAGEVFFVAAGIPLCLKGAEERS